MNAALNVSDPTAETPDYSGRPLAPDRVAAIEKHAGASVLDVGCGNGAYVLHYADRFAIRGVDYREFNAWQRRPELFSVSDAERLTHADASVDTVLSFEVLEHLRNPLQALREYFRVTRKNIILTVPNCALTSGMRASGVIYNHWIDRTHINFWDLDSISELVRSAGFRIVGAQHINRLSLGHVFAESLGFGGFLARGFARVHRMIARPRYHMTCLIIGERPAAIPAAGTSDGNSNPSSQ